MKCKWNANVDRMNLKAFMLFIAGFRNFMNNEYVNIESFHNNNNFLAVCANRFETILFLFFPWTLWNVWLKNIYQFNEVYVA